MCILGQRGIVLMGVVLDYVIRPIGRHSEILVENELGVIFEKLWQLQGTYHQICE